MTDYSPIRFRPADERSILGSHGHSIRSRRPPSDPKFPTPKDHYLIYLQQVDGELDIRRFYDYRIPDIDQSEKELVDLARKFISTPAYKGRGFKDLLWRYPCYLTIVLDNENWEFYWGDTEGEDPITFREERFGNQYHENFSFYNAQLVRVPIFDDHNNHVGERAAVRCENHIKRDAHGNHLGEHERRRYKLDLNVWQPTSGGGHNLNVIDPDGENQGPPSVP